MKGNKPSSGRFVEYVNAHMHAMKRYFAIVTCLTIALCERTEAAFDHGLLDAVLKDHVQRGLVDYRAVKEDARLAQYLEQLATADLSLLDTGNEKMAFYINAYNAYTLQLVASAYPTTSIRLIDALGSTADSVDEASPWKIEFAVIAGETYSLDHIEHEILRKDFDGDPRIHFAIVCAAISCPILRSEAFVAERLDEQLESQGKWFFAWRNSFDAKAKTARLSKIIEWFEVDFGGSKEASLKTALPYLEPRLARALEGNEAEWEVVYAAYDWTLNSQARNR